MISRLAGLISSSLLSGLLLLLPPVLAVGILYWLVMVLEEYARPVLLWLLPEGWYRPGVGTLAVLVLVLMVGMLARNTLLKRLLGLVTRALEALPVLGPLYRALRDLSAMLADDGSRSASRPVMVRVPGLGMDLLALELPRGVEVRLPPSTDQVLLYFPMTYQIGGFMGRVPRDWVEPLEMSSMEALQYIIGGGIGSGRESAEDAAKVRPDGGPTPDSSSGQD